MHLLAASSFSEALNKVTIEGKEKSVAPYHINFYPESKPELKKHPDVRFLVEKVEALDTGQI